MAYEKLLNEIYAAISLEYLWSEYVPEFVKSESPDWVNEAMGMGLEVSQALMPEDGQAESFIEKYLGHPKEELPESAFSKYGDRLYFYNNRFWAILPENSKGPDCLCRAEFRFDRKLEKLNDDYRVCSMNGLYLFLHPAEDAAVDIPALFTYMQERQRCADVGFDWVFLNCNKAIYVCDFSADTIEEIPLVGSTGMFLANEAEQLRHDRTWNSGAHLNGYAVQVMRATQLWQQAGAYYVRIQGMNRQHHIPLDKEFDERDGTDMKYLVLLDKGYPMGTCRLFPISDDTAEIGRVVVLDEYRGMGFGKLLIKEAEKWIKELGFKKAFVDSRDVAVKFYEKLGYHAIGKPKAGDIFVCIPMEKAI